MDARCLGENGAPELTAKGVDEPLVALFFKLVRDLPDASLKELLAGCTGGPADLADLVVLAFQTRATRGMGKGEKMLFYKMLALLPVEAVLATPAAVKLMRSSMKLKPTSLRHGEPAE